MTSVSAQAAAVAMARSITIHPQSQPVEMERVAVGAHALHVFAHPADLVSAQGYGAVDPPEADGEDC